MIKILIGLFLFVSGLWGQQVSYANAIVPQMPVGCTWTATIVLVNLTSREIGFTVNFWPEGGITDPNATPAPRIISILGLGAVGSVKDIVPASGSFTIQVDESARSQTTDCNGWAEVNSDEALGGYVLLDQKVTIQSTEFHYGTTVPISSRFANHFVVPFDATNFTTAIAIVNPSFQVFADITITYRDNSGNVICSESKTLFPGEEQAFPLAPVALAATSGVSSTEVCGDPKYQHLQGKRGVVEFLTSNLEFSGFGLRFNPLNLGFVSYPAQSPIGQ